MKLQMCDDIAFFVVLCIVAFHLTTLLPLIVAQKITMRYSVCCCNIQLLLASIYKHVIILQHVYNTCTTCILADQVKCNVCMEVEFSSCRDV